MVYISPVAPLNFRPREKQKEQPSAGELTTTAVARQKRCAKCGEKKDVNEYPKHTTSSDGRAAYCRTCKNGLAKERRLKDPIARITHYTVTRIKNEWPKEKIPKDIQTNLEHYLGYRLSALKRALREDAKERYGKTLIACFKEEMHLDHIQPHSSFRPLDIGDGEFQRQWAITNLRLIPSTENLRKGAKTDFYGGNEITGVVIDEWEGSDEFDEDLFDEEGSHIVDLIA